MSRRRHTAASGLREVSGAFVSSQSCFEYRVAKAIRLKRQRNSATWWFFFFCLSFTLSAFKHLPLVVINSQFFSFKFDFIFIFLVVYILMLHQNRWKWIIQWSAITTIFCSPACVTPIRRDLLGTFATERRKKRLKSLRWHLVRHPSL